MAPLLADHRDCYEDSAKCLACDTAFGLVGDACQACTAANCTNCDGDAKVRASAARQVVGGAYRGRWRLRHQLLRIS